MAARARSAPRPAARPRSPRGGAPSPRGVYDKNTEQVFLGSLNTPTPKLQNMDPQLDELQALVRSSREEQAVIQSKIVALKGGAMATSPALRSGIGFGSPGVPSDELAALHEELVRYADLLLQRDAEVETLKSRLKVMLTHADEPKSGAAWRQRYELAQRSFESGQKDVQHMKVEMERSRMEVTNLTAYLKVLETEQKSNNAQRERLVKESKTLNENGRALEVERNSLAQQLRSLEEGFLRCVGRVTQSLASGVATVNLNDGGAEARFVILRINSDGDGVLEIFREPDAHDELLALELSTAGGATAVADKDAKTILLTSSSGKPGKETLRLSCVGMEEFGKWTSALRVVGLELDSKALAIKR